MKLITTVGVIGVLALGDAAMADRVSEEKLPFELALASTAMDEAARDGLRGQADAYRAALVGCYLWHEFGDLQLPLP